MAIVPLAAGAAWALAGWLGPWGLETAAAGAAGAGLVAVLAAACLLCLQPWKVRPISEWMNWWMGGTLLRLIAVPAATYLLYSATSFSALALILGVGLTYVVTLLAEAAVLAQHVRRAA